MELPQLIVGILGNGVSLMVFVAPVPTFFRIITKRTTEDFSAVPYVACFFAQLMWVYYGVLDPKGLLITTISAIGAALEIIYVTVYMVLASKPQRLSTVRLSCLGSLILLIILIGTLLGAQGNKRLYIVGLLAGINAVCMFAAPLSVMRQVIRTKSVEYMPLFLSLCLFVCGGVWSSYALIVRDLFVLVPNGIGFLLGTAQLLLYAIYYKRTSDRLAEASKSIESKTTGDMEKKRPGDQAL